MKTTRKTLILKIKVRSRGAFRWDLMMRLRLSSGFLSNFTYIWWKGGNNNKTFIWKINVNFILSSFACSTFTSTWQGKSKITYFKNILNHFMLTEIQLIHTKRRLNNQISSSNFCLFSSLILCHEICSQSCFLSMILQREKLTRIPTTWN